MDEEQTRGKCSDTLDLEAPLLSTRRLGGLACPQKPHHSEVEASTCSDTSRWIPFLWERAPGKPKDMEGLHVEEPIPPPKLPPCRWSNVNNVDDGDDGDDEDDIFSDAMDIMSLPESLAVEYSTNRLSELDGIDFKNAESWGDQPPNFIMNRFLRAASALASSAVLSASKNRDKKVSPHRHGPEKETSTLVLSHQSNGGKLAGEYGPHGAIRSHSPPKACGFMFFFPWSLKNALCGTESPFQNFSTRLKLKTGLRRSDAARGDNGPGRPRS